MRKNDATARMQEIFVSYHTILNQNGFKWIIKDNQSVAVRHVLSAVRPLQLKERLESDIAFAYRPLCKDFQGFLKHAIKLVEAFQLVDAGPTKKKKKNDDGTRQTYRPGGSGGSGNSDKSKHKTTESKDDTKFGGKTPDLRNPLPLCLREPHKQKGFRQYLKECPDCPEEDRKQILTARAKKLAEDGPAKGTRSGGKPIVGRLHQKSVDLSQSPSCPIVVSDGMVSLNANGRCDDGSDDSIASPVLAQRAVCKVIGRFEAIAPVMIKVALTNSEEAESFTFSRIWKVPMLVMELSAGCIALNNISFLVADDDLACEDLLMGIPLLRHLGIDSRTLLERNRATLDETDCSSVRHADLCGSLGRLKISRLSINPSFPEQSDSDSGADSESDTQDSEKEHPADLDPDRPRKNYFAQRCEEDPFPDPNLVDLPSTQLNSAEQDIKDMVERTKDNGFPKTHLSELEKLVAEHGDIFSTEFQREQANIDPLRIELTPDARPIRVKLRNYSQSQREFMTNMTDDVLRATGSSSPIQLPSGLAPLCWSQSQDQRNGGSQWT